MLSLGCKLSTLDPISSDQLKSELVGPCGPYKEAHTFDILCGSFPLIWYSGWCAFNVLSTDVLPLFSYLNYVHPWEDNVLKSVPRWAPKALSVHSIGDTGDDPSLSAANFPLSQTHKPCFSCFKFGLHFSSGHRLYTSRSVEGNPTYFFLPCSYLLFIFYWQLHNNILKETNRSQKTLTQVRGRRNKALCHRETQKNNKLHGE